jgi:hypothetical protein
VLLTATDPRALRPVAIGLHLIAELIRLHGRDFEWLPYPTAANEGGHQHFDRLIGRMEIRRELDRGGASLASQIQEWTLAPDWKERAMPHLMYD